MSSYESFAQVYDELMDEVPYGIWAERINCILCSYGIHDGLMLELGCGTGKMMECLSEYGYDMIGVDSSIEMLQIAGKKAVLSGKDFLYLHQDMRSFELYGTVKSVICVCDSINYITSPGDLIQVFRLVNNYLDPGGIFVFDFNTEFKYRDMIGESVIAEDREDVSFIWFNEYDQEEHLNYIDLSVFIREEDGRYRKFVEEHIQKGYTLEDMTAMIRDSGLTVLSCFDGYTDKKAEPDSERIVIVAREKGKARKGNMAEDPVMSR